MAVKFQRGAPETTHDLGCSPATGMIPSRSRANRFPDSIAMHTPTSASADLLLKRNIECPRVTVTDRRVPCSSGSSRYAYADMSAAC